MDIIKDLLGLGMEANKLTVFQVLLRAMIVFLAAIVMVRMADKRFLSRMSAVDVILGFILGKLGDYWFHTTWLYLAGLIFGAVVGFVEMIRMAMASTKDKQ